MVEVWRGGNRVPRNRSEKKQGKAGGARRPSAKGRLSPVVDRAFELGPPFPRWHRCRHTGNAEESCVGVEKICLSRKQPRPLAGNRRNLTAERGPAGTGIRGTIWMETGRVNSGLRRGCRDEG